MTAPRAGTATSRGLAPTAVECGAPMPIAPPSIFASIVEAVVVALEQRPDLVERLRVLLAPPVPPPPPSSADAKFMSVAEYAKHARLSEGTIRNCLKDDFVLGEHFHRAGRSGRRVVVHVAESDAWFAARSAAQAEARTIEQLANDELLQRRARVALRKDRGGSR